MREILSEEAKGSHSSIPALARNPDDCGVASFERPRFAETGRRSFTLKSASTKISPSLDLLGESLVSTTMNRF